jgi:hypothetical protein
MSYILALIVASAAPSDGVITTSEYTTILTSEVKPLPVTTLHIPKGALAVETVFKLKSDSPLHERKGLCFYGKFHKPLGCLGGFSICEAHEEARWFKPEELR